MLRFFLVLSALWWVICSLVAVFNGAKKLLKTQRVGNPNYRLSPSDYLIILFVGVCGPLSLAFMRWLDGPRVKPS